MPTEENGGKKLMLQIGTEFTLKQNHGLLNKGERVKVKAVEESYRAYWVRLMSCERYDRSALVIVRPGEEQDI